jgi:hypothetical protein
MMMLLTPVVSIDDGRESVSATLDSSISPKRSLLVVNMEQEFGLPTSLMCGVKAISHCR